MADPDGRPFFSGDLHRGEDADKAGRRSIRTGRVLPAYEGRPANWTYYATDKEGRHYYSKVEEATPSPGIERVWTRLDFSEEGKNLYLAKRNSISLSLEGYQQLSTQECPVRIELL